MLKQIFVAALVSTTLVANTAAPAFANNDEGSDSTFWEDRAKAKKVVKKVTKAKPARTRAVPSRSATIKLDHGKTRTVKDNGDGTRTITDRGPDGGIITRRIVGRTPDHAINHTNHTMSVGVNPGVRVVIGPFGFGLSFSN